MYPARGNRTTQGVEQHRLAPKGVKWRQKEREKHPACLQGTGNCRRTTKQAKIDTKRELADWKEKNTDKQGQGVPFEW